MARRGLPCGGFFSGKVRLSDLVGTWQSRTGVLVQFGSNGRGVMPGPAGPLPLQWIDQGGQLILSSGGEFSTAFVQVDQRTGRVVLFSPMVGQAVLDRRNPVESRSCC